MSRSEPHGGPYDSKPMFEPKDTSDYRLTVTNKKHRQRHGYWAQARDGKWYAFWSVGPQDPRWNIEHPFDPRFWGKSPDANPYDGRQWCCRHEWMAFAIECSCWLPTPATDDEVNEAVTKLRHLAAELSDKPVS